MNIFILKIISKKIFYKINLETEPPYPPAATEAWLVRVAFWPGLAALINEMKSIMCYFDHLFSSKDKPLYFIKITSSPPITN